MSGTEGGPAAVQVRNRLTVLHHGMRSRLADVKQASGNLQAGRSKNPLARKRIEATTNLMDHVKLLLHGVVGVADDLHFELQKTGNESLKSQD